VNTTVGAAEVAPVRMTPSVGSTLHLCESVVAGIPFVVAAVSATFVRALGATGAVLMDWIVGGGVCALEMTVTLTVSVAVLPMKSVTVSVRTYAPGAAKVTFGEAAFALENVAPPPSGTVVAAQEKVMVRFGMP